MQVNKDFVLRKIHGKSLLMPIRYNDAINDPMFLNSVATLIWEFAENGMTADEIVAQIDKKYDLMVDSIEEVAIKNFLQELVKMNLIFE